MLYGRAARTAAATADFPDPLLPRNVTSRVELEPTAASPTRYTPSAQPMRDSTMEERNVISSRRRDSKAETSGRSSVGSMA